MLANPVLMPVMDDFSKTFGNHFLSEVQKIMPDTSNTNQLLNDSLAAARPHRGDTLDILSAETYPSIPVPDRTSQPNKRRASEQLYGGLAFEESSSNSSNEAGQDQVYAKKRSKRTSKSDEEENSKKQRGRPRLETQDETAADRRRTQIRLAQRAYRHRKEITISALKKKVEFLQNTIEAMNKSYVNLHDNFIDTGLFESRPVLFQQLKNTLEEFAAFTNQVADSENEDDENEKDPSNPADIGSEQMALTKSNRRANSKSREIGTRTAHLGYELSYGRSQEMDMGIQDLQMFESQNNNMELQNEETDLSSLKEWNAMQSFQQYNVQLPEQHFDEQTLYTTFSTIEKPLKASQPYTYSFQETTFSRRLHRLCLERAFRNLNNSRLDRVFLDRAFRFTYCYSNRANLLLRFQELLKRRAGESLENWNMPFFNIGGAGTHFPRRDENGSPIYPPNMHSPNSLLRPPRLRFVNPETPRPEQSPEEMLEAMGYGGEWFDSHDVEEYLKLRGIHLDGTSSFVEVDPGLVSLPALVSGASSPADVRASPLLRTPSPSLHLEGFLDREVQETFAAAFDFDLAAQAQAPPDKSPVTDAAWPDFGLAVQSGAYGYVPTLQDAIGQRGRSVTVDVSKFLERMVIGAACLGRAPGFRRSHVDNALALSLQEAF